MRVNSKLSKTILTFCTGAALAVAQTPATGAAGAQSGATGSGAQSGAGSHTPVEKHAGHKEDHGMSSSHGAGLMVGQTDQQFIIKAAQGGLMEVEAARLAQEKATSNEIKEYARKLEQDHSKANEQLKKIAAQKNVDLPTDMGHHRAMLDKVRAASGDQFDKQWMKMQVQHHKKDVSDFQKHTNRAMDSDVRSFASATLPTLQEHLRQAQELESSTRGRKGGSSMSGNSGSSASGSGSSASGSGSSAAGSGSSASGSGSGASGSGSGSGGNTSPTK
jgi:putative membrane protein